MIDLHKTCFFFFFSKFCLASSIHICFYSSLVLKFIHVVGPLNVKTSTNDIRPLICYRLI